MIAIEAIPYLYYEDISNGRWTPVKFIPATDYEFPYDIKVVLYPGDKNFQVAGSAACASYIEMVYYNVRYINPYSPWYSDYEIIATIVHECAHINDSSCDIWHSDLEPATQVATLEVLAAMTRQRNPYALVPFLMELRSYVGNYLLLQCLEDGTGAEWMVENYYSRLPNAEWRTQSFLKFMASRTPDNLRLVLRNYAVRPYEILLGALNNAANGFVTCWLPVANEDRNIRMDDTYYVISAIEALVDEYVATGGEVR